MKTLAVAIALTSRGHEGLREKNGNPYILHPLQLIMNLMGLRPAPDDAPCRSFQADAPGATAYGHRMRR